MDCDILLYTTGNQYYIITYSHDTYQEYYVAVDSLNRIINFYDNSHDETIKKLETKNNLSLKKRKYLSRLLYDKKIILETFDAIQHSKSLISSEPITSIPFCEISPSYFVIKERNNVIVEYFSESNLLPYPVNLDLSIYLLRELASCRIASANRNPGYYVGETKKERVQNERKNELEAYRIQFSMDEDSIPTAFDDGYESITGRNLVKVDGYEGLNKYW